MVYLTGSEVGVAHYIRWVKKLFFRMLRLSTLIGQTIPCSLTGRLKFSANSFLLCWSGCDHRCGGTSLLKEPSETDTCSARESTSKGVRVGIGPTEKHILTAQIAWKPKIFIGIRMVVMG